MAHLSEEDFFPSYFDGFPIPADPQNVAAARAFCLEKWRERSLQKFPNDAPPVDLAGACKFSSMFASVVFGEDIAGNWHHVFNVLAGEIVDLNAEASDVAGLADPYLVDAEFFEEPEFHESMRSCVARVSNWVEEFRAAMAETPAALRT